MQMCKYAIVSADAKSECEHAIGLVSSSSTFSSYSRPTPELGVSVDGQTDGQRKYNLFFPLGSLVSKAISI